MSNIPNINFARAEGILKGELAGDIVFTLVYVPLFFFNVFRSFRHPTYVLISLSVFCAIRIAAFGLRAVLAGSDTAGTNVNVVVAQGIIYSVGFFGLLYSAYTLTLDRLQMTDHNEISGGGPLWLIRKFTRERRVVRIILIVAVALGITGGVDSSSTDPSKQSTGESLRRVSVYIFLGISVALLIVTADLAWDEHQDSTRRESEPVGRKYRLIVVAAIALLCLVREAFFAATSFNTVKQNSAHFFFPLAALPEFLAVCFFAAPGLVPSRTELLRRAEAQRNGVEFAELTRGSGNSNYGYA